MGCGWVGFGKTLEEALLKIQQAGSVAALTPADGGVWIEGWHLTCLGAGAMGVWAGSVSWSKVTPVGPT